MNLKKLGTFLDAIFKKTEACTVKASQSDLLDHLERHPDIALVTVLDAICNFDQNVDQLLRGIQIGITLAHQSESKLLNEIVEKIELNQWEIKAAKDAIKND